MASNPVSVPIPGDTSEVLITCVAHAAYYQRVTLARGSNILTVFQGTGEGVPMKTTDGQTSYQLGASRQGYQVTATFEFSESGPNGPFHMAKVSDPITTKNGNLELIQVTSEDSTDNDNNDSYLNFEVELI